MREGSGSFGVTQFVGVGGCRVHSTPHITTEPCQRQLQAPLPPQGCGQPTAVVAVALPSPPLEACSAG